ncbi:uncharacterized protein LOC133724604 isoform X2 [Rosa rugosa]|uniref:uncharacterized protein LOC133724604 isoform X2 n=1 Tax=Rosa rugosa TaxID=74645 RepID=UPI002B4025AA|nr:uncharacterized protein LOC133724604 isoform X2 [Rosa rugosa]
MRPKTRILIQTRPHATNFLLIPLCSISHTTILDLVPMGNQNFKSFFIDHSDHLALVIVFNQHNRPNQSNRQNGSSCCSPLSEQQLQQVLAILNHKVSDDSSSPHSQANAAITKPGLSKIASRSWIIDSRATDHISSSPKLFSHKSKNCSLPPVLLPSGEKANIVAKGSLPLNSVYYLRDVLIWFRRERLVWVSNVTVSTIWWH